MSSSSGSVSKERAASLPVFVYPEELRFVESDRDTHKQVLTIYNPYSFGIRFEVFCTAPDHYTVVESSGCIKANCCVDIVVRHRTASTGNGPYMKEDKFRIDIYVEKKMIGRRTILSTLMKGTSTKEGLDDEGQTTNGHIRRNSREVNMIPVVRPGDAHVGSSMVMLLVAIFSVVVLLLPLKEDDHSSTHLPQWLFITVNHKLFAAFTLGMVTMAIMRP